jgi:putative chitinase
MKKFIENMRNRYIRNIMHGLIQITGYYNHKKCGEALGIDAVNNPAILSTYKYAALSACWFFATHGCNELADAGDFKGQTRRINGCYNGFEDRKKHLVNAQAAYKDWK